MQTATVSQLAAQHSRWFASWFDSSHYHKLYGYRNHVEAAGFVDALTARLRPPRGSRALDLGCGTGRHARYLAARGFDVTGLDLSEENIREARQYEGERLRFVRSDMRLPFGARAFNYVFNFFTSFGYFEQWAEHLLVVRNIARALTPGGRLVLDYLNVPYADTHLETEEERRLDGVVYRISRWTDSAHFFKRIVVHEPRHTPVEYLERVARLTVSDFERLFAFHGLSLEETHGDYRLAPYAESSPRLILIAKKTGRRYDDRRDRFLRMRLTVSGDTPRYDASIHCGTRSAIVG
jgi:SAM-dependent methyltransferase